jgi:phospholipid/cholesterol/gamma-HCH transport system ATP-binding protein
VERTVSGRTGEVSNPVSPVNDDSIHIAVRDLEMGYGTFVIQRDLTFDVRRGEVFAIMGGSGCGKSTLMRHLIGLKEPASGDIFINGVNLWKSSKAVRDEIMRGAGVLFQGGALWSSMTLEENVGMVLEEYTDLSAKDIGHIVSLKLSLVGLEGFEGFYPSEISGGMRKRAGLARAMALDPEILYFDEPSGGLDPISSRRLDDLILELRDSFGTTIVMATHELASIFAVAENSIFLDPDSKTMIARGNPGMLLEESGNPKVQAFLRRGEL